jgi:hypothetical protein
MTRTTNVEEEIVKLAGTEFEGIKRRGERATSVVYSKEHPKPSVYDGDISIWYDQLQNEITDGICRLSDLLSRLRRLDIEALDGDERAVGEAGEVLSDEDRGYLDEDQLDYMEGTVAALEKLAAGRTESRKPIIVTKAEVESVVRELILPFLLIGGHYVVVRTYDGEPRALNAQINFERSGRRVNVSVHPAGPYEPYKLPEGTTAESVYKQAVALKGEAAASQIWNAVCSVEKDEDKRVMMLAKAVGL